MRTPKIPAPPGSILRATCVVLVVGLFAAISARADVIPSLTSGPTVSGSNFAYNYEALLTSGESLDPTATNGVTCPGPGATLVQCNPEGTFFTIYDIPGYVSASAPTNWTASTQLIGVTPSTINGSFDDPTLVNVTFTYTGPEVIAGTSGIAFTSFQIVSTDDALNLNGVYSAQATETSNGDTDQTDGTVTIPGVGGVTTTPEPGTLVLFGSGLLGIAGLIRRRARL
jgi:hypothetical protein